MIDLSGNDWNGLMAQFEMHPYFPKKKFLFDIFLIFAVENFHLFI